MRGDPRAGHQPGGSRYGSRLNSGFGVSHVAWPCERGTLDTHLEDPSSGALYPVWEGDHLRAHAPLRSSAQFAPYPRRGRAHDCL